MAKVILKGFIIIPMDNKQEILTAFDEHIKLTKQEVGCITFDITPDNICQDKYWVYEEFVDKAAFKLHQARVRSSDWGKVSVNVQRHYEPLIVTSV